MSWQEGELRGWKRQRKAERVSREVKANHGHMERGRKGMWRKGSKRVRKKQVRSRNKKATKGGG